MIIALDVSGNFEEGFGTTGINYMYDNGEIHKADELKAIKFKSTEEYWDAHIDLFNRVLDAVDLEVVMEGFRLYGHKSATQTNSQFETPQLIGVIRHWCWKNDVPLKIQYAVEVKKRWPDEILIKEGYIYLKGKTRYLTATNQILNNHKTDALRHALHYKFYTREKHIADRG